MGESIWQAMERRGYSRREFLQFCAAAATAAGLGQPAVGQVASAFEKKEKPPVVWIHFQECTGCSESFIRAAHPVVAEALLDVISPSYWETLAAPSVFQGEECLSDPVANNKGKYIMVVDGAVSAQDGGVYCMIGSKTAEQNFRTIAKDAAAIVAWGACAAFGGLQAAHSLPPDAVPFSKLVDKPVINVPGCPPITEVMMSVVTHLLVLGKLPALDSQGRPKEFYGRRAHDTGYRRPKYDDGLFVEARGDDGARTCYSFSEMGGKIPATYNACSVTRWNDGVGYPVEFGHGRMVNGDAGF